MGFKGQAAASTCTAAAEGKGGVAEGQCGWAGSPWHSSCTQEKHPGGFYSLAIAWGCRGAVRKAKAWLESVWCGILRTPRTPAPAGTWGKHGPSAQRGRRASDQGHGTGTECLFVLAFTGRVGWLAQSLWKWSVTGQDWVQRNLSEVHLMWSAWWCRRIWLMSVHCLFLLSLTGCGNGHLAVRSECLIPFPPEDSIRDLGWLWGFVSTPKIALAPHFF